MLISWDDNLLCYLPDDDGIEVTDELWHNYETVMRVKMEMEDEFRRLSTPPAPLDDDLEALRGTLSEDELQALQARRMGTPTVQAVAEVEPLAVQAVAEEVPAAAVEPIGGRCPKSPGGQGPHVCLRYMRDDSNGTLIGLCKCGRQVQNPDCPHQTQVRRGRHIACADCGKVVIPDTGFHDNDTGSDRYVPPPPPPRIINVPQPKGW